VRQNGGGQVKVNFKISPSVVEALFLLRHTSFRDLLKEVELFLPLLHGFI
jgi:hypothetical protein